MSPTPATDWSRYPTLLRPLATGAAVWAVVSLPFVTDAGAGLLYVLFVIPGAGLLALVWVGATAGSLSAGFRPRLDRTTATWAATPGLLAAVWLIGWSEVGLIARVRLSERALLAGNPPPGLIGLFYVNHTEGGTNGAVAFDTGGLIDRVGLLYLPAGAPPPLGWKAVGHLTGDWHRGYWRF